MPLLPETRLGPYQIRSLLGSGGMGEVYLAHDTRLGRDVAVKVLPEPVSGNPDRLRRFEQEARAAAALNHPGILAVYDVGWHEGSPYIVSELLEGETLRDRLRAGGFTVQKALEVALPLARALAAAHEKGIVHRDLKPENVFLTRDQQVKVLDFGLAKLLPRPEPGSESPMDTKSTASGIVLGTAAYMSPEQVRAQETDARSDVFSFGVVLYEMLAGRRPFRGDTAADVMAAILQEDPPKLLDLPATGASASGPKRMAVLPFENLGAAEDGYFADGMTDEVRSKLAGLSDLAVIARASSNEYKGSKKPQQQIAQELAVGYLLTATVRWQKSGQTSRIRLTSELVEVGGVGAPTTRWQEAFEADPSDVFRVQGEIATKVARSLEVALSGKERGQLTARPTSNLAAYEAYLKGQEIEKGAGGPPTLRLAATQYEQAVALDPGFALAWARLSNRHSWIYYGGGHSLEEAEAARKAAERAMELAPSMPEGHVALGVYYRLVREDPAKALEAYARGLSFAPDDALLLQEAGMAERTQGRWEEALAHLRRARELDPRFWEHELMLAATLLDLRRIGETRVACDRGLVLAPANLHLIEYKAMTFLQEGDLAGARGVIAAAPKEVEPAALVADFAGPFDLYWVLDDAQRDVLLRLTPGAFGGNRWLWAITLAQAWALRGDQAKTREYAEVARKAGAARLAENPQNAQVQVFYGLVLAYLGRSSEAVREAERGVALTPIATQPMDGPYHQHQLVRIHIVVGNHEKALDLLEPLLRVPYVLTPGWLRIDPNFDPLRGNPRFEKLAHGA